MFGKCFVFALLFSSLSITVFGQKKLVNDPDFYWSLQSLNMIGDKKVSSVKREIFHILEFASDAKKSARLYGKQQFLMNDAEIDCHGETTKRGEKSIGLVEVKQLKNGEMVIYGYDSATDINAAVTLYIKHDVLLGSTQLEWIGESKKITANLIFGGKSTLKITKNGEMTASISWNHDGSGKWMKLSKAGKYSGGDLSKAETTLAVSGNDASTEN